MNSLPLIFTDLDGSLLDHHDYRWHAAAHDIDTLKNQGIPLIYNTSKTYPECFKLQQNMGINEPFIIENGGAIVFPDNSELLDLVANQTQPLKDNPAHILQLGSEYLQLSALLNEWIEQFQFPVIGFHQMTAEEIAQATGLSLEDAKLAACRSSSLPFTFNGSNDQFSILENLAQSHRLKILKGGRFYHLIGLSDKGSALIKLASLYNKISNTTRTTLAFGDSQNDIAMLEACDYPTAIPSALGQLLALSNSNAFYATKSGPAGWSQGFSHQMRAINFL